MNSNGYRVNRHQGHAWLLFLARGQGLFLHSSHYDADLFFLGSRTLHWKQACSDLTNSTLSQWHCKPLVCRYPHRYNRCSPARLDGDAELVGRTDTIRPATTPVNYWHLMKRIVGQAVRLFQCPASKPTSLVIQMVSQGLVGPGS